MRSPVRYTLVPAVLFAVAACSRDDRSAAVDPLLARDLQLASTALALAPTAQSQLDQLETAPPVATPEAAPRPRRAASGPRRIQSPRPTVSAAPVSDEASTGEMERTVDVAAVDANEVDGLGDEAVVEAGVALPRPTPASAGLPGVGSGDDGSWTRGAGGGIIGVVLRGGGVGGIDDCVPGERPRGSRHPYPATRPPTIDTRGEGPVWRQAPRSTGASGSTGRVAQGSTGRSSGPVWRRN